jgi:hypothetical protein
MIARIAAASTTNSVKSNTRLPDRTVSSVVAPPITDPPTRPRTPAVSHAAHHQPIRDHVRECPQFSSPPLAFQSSRVDWNGFTRFAKGTNHQPTAHPGVNRSPVTPAATRLACPRCCQTSQTIPVMTRVRSCTTATAAIRESDRVASSSDTNSRLAIRASSPCSSSRNAIMTSASRELRPRSATITRAIRSPDRNVRAVVTSRRRTGARRGARPPQRLRRSRSATHR